MSVNQILEHEIKDSEIWLSRTPEESTYKRDLKKEFGSSKYKKSQRRNLKSY